MKHVVMMSEMKGSDIRPPAILSKFRDLSIEDCRTYFPREALAEISCPACQAEGRSLAYQKYGFQYHQCSGCRSVYVSPRPTAEAMAEYFRSSRASQLKAGYLAQETAEARRIHVLRARAHWMGRIVDECGNFTASKYADLGSNYPLLFDEVGKLGVFGASYCLNPSPMIDQKLIEGKATISFGSLSGLGAISLLEQLENRFSPADLIQSAHEMLSPGGILFLTTRTISGFDLQTLWDKAPYIFVPEHLNLLSIEGLSQLISRCGFKLLELSTPGQLDVEMVLEAIKEDPSIRVPPFLDYLLNHRSKEALEDFQAFLQRNRLSSHVRIAAIKTEGEQHV